jgi:alpha-galactosidase
MMVGWFTDWRTGLEEYGKANSNADPRYIFDWKAATPVGWNSWGVMQNKLTLAKVKGVVDFFADSCRGFRNGDSTLYIDLDAYWDNMCSGGITGDLSNLKDFCQYCKSKGFRPGVYWAPFADWGKNGTKVVEGSSWHYGDCWTKINGNYSDLDGGRAMDPTHPATRARIALYIDRLKSCGFQMIKIDFLGHGTLEADHFYDPTVHTGMQAFRKGMEYVIDQLDGKMLVYAAISPSLATGRYVHMRRIACDAFKRIDETAYTLNSTTYGWWLGKIYNYMDADHVVFGTESEGSNRARLTSLVITGTLITGDDYSVNGHWIEAAKTLLQNPDILSVVRGGQSFRPVNGNTGNQPDNFFTRINGSHMYLAIINYSDSAMEYTIDPAGLGLKTRKKDFAIKELFSGINTLAKEKLKLTVKASDAVIYRIDTRK